MEVKTQSPCLSTLVDIQLPSCQTGSYSESVRAELLFLNKQP